MENARVHSKVKDSFAGRKVKCKTCGCEILVPFVETKNAGGELEIIDSGDTLVSKSKRRRKQIVEISERPIWKWWIIALIFAVSFGAGSTVFAFFGIVAALASFVIILVAIALAYDKAIRFFRQQRIEEADRREMTMFVDSITVRGGLTKTTNSDGQLVEIETEVKYSLRVAGFGACKVSREVYRQLRSNNCYEVIASTIHGLKIHKVIRSAGVHADWEKDFRESRG